MSQDRRQQDLEQEIATRDQTCRCLRVQFAEDGAIMHWEWVPVLDRDVEVEHAG